MFYNQFTEIVLCIVESRKLDKLLIPMQALAKELPNELIPLPAQDFHLF